MATNSGRAIDPIEQFHLHKIYDLNVFGLDISLTKVSLFMFVVVFGIVALMFMGTRRAKIMPGRLQTVVEMFYEMIASMVQTMIGDAGMKFFPLIFSLFSFVLFSNMIGLIPHTFTVTSQLVVTFALALLVIGTVVIHGFWAHGLRFFNVFVPSGVSKALLPFLVIMEVISFLSRPISLGIRLFANMLAGHITLKVFAGFSALLVSAGGWAFLAPLPFLGTCFITLFEILVAFLQAYVFAILTCIYLNDSVHPGH